MEIISYAALGMMVLLTLTLLEHLIEFSLDGVMLTKLLYKTQINGGK
nr:hypothetical protein [Moritella viscosa]